MSSKVKETGKHRMRQFRRACRAKNLTALGAFGAAATQANEANADKAEWKTLERNQILDAFGNFEIAERLDKFEAPKWLHDWIDRTLGQPPLKPPRSNMKARHVRQQGRSTGATSLSA